ncbi:MAG TPA: S-methyl-5'-thioadenosine phosphorylase [Polyangiaceae bacterium]|nr:S-methyl-5'-thioadenosine phosphorylase [Polyangiaceae bacterium]
MTPTLAILGGSGLYGLAENEPQRSIAASTPYGAPSGNIQELELSGSRVLFLARHGAGHRLAAHEVNYRANVFALKALGATHLLSVSAVGSLRLDFEPGHIVTVDQYIDNTKRRASTFFEGQGVVVHASLADPVDASFSQLLCRVARELDATVHDAGTYLCIEGPQFSTRAESKLYRALGADVIGMTNLPEARLAREAELAYASLCFVTDYDAWHESELPVQVENVLQQLHQNAALARRILARLIERSSQLPHSAAARALDQSLLTAPAQISADVRLRLAPLLERVLRARGG